jgi:hypothetical protein
MLSTGANVILWDEILSSGMKCYYNRCFLWMTLCRCLSSGFKFPNNELFYYSILVTTYDFHRGLINVRMTGPTRISVCIPNIEHKVF